MFIDPEEAQVRVSMIVRVDQNDIGSLRHSGDYYAIYRSKNYHFIFHKFIDCLNFLILEDKASTARWNIFEQLIPNQEIPERGPSPSANFSTGHPRLFNMLTQREQSGVSLEVYFRCSPWFKPSLLPPSNRWA